MALGVINYFSGMGFSPVTTIILLLAMAWDLVWKLMAMWRAARKNSPVWFVVLLLFNTIGILPILYIYVFSKMKFGKKKEEKPVKQRRRKRKG